MTTASPELYISLHQGFKCDLLAEMLARCKLRYVARPKPESLRPSGVKGKASRVSARCAGLVIDLSRMREVTVDAD
jgi:hypothetical protein